VMRNDHQDALAAGLAVSELSPFGKSADEMRDLWRWVETRMNGGVSVREEISHEVSDVEFPIILSPEHIRAPAAEKAAPRPLATLGAGFDPWAGLHEPALTSGTSDTRRSIVRSG